MRLEILPIHLFQVLGYDTADKTITSGRAMLAPTIAIGAIRLGIATIQLLQVLGYESANKTVAVRYRDTALNNSSNVGGAIATAASS